MIFRLERNPGCKRSQYIGGRDDADESPPAWIEVFAIVPDRLVRYKEPYLDHIQQIVCICYCMSDHGFFTVSQDAIMNAVGNEEYRIIPGGVEPQGGRTATKKPAGPKGKR